MSFRLCAPVLLGLEGICADELRRLDFADVSAENGRVLFSGDLTEALRANLWLRTAERVQILLGEFPAATFDQLFEGVKATPLEEIIDANGAFPVKGHSTRSRLTSIPDCQKIIKKAAAVRLGSVYGYQTMPETGAKYQLSFHIMNDRCSLYLDTTGASLHKRGYRAEANAAPIRETLAAAMVFLSRRRGDRPLCDPLCGSGTILIEAALMASNTAPGLNRPFAMEGFAGVDPAVGERLREEARSLVRSFDGEIFGSDRDHAAIGLARANAEKAGMGKVIRFTKAELSEARFPESGIIITNPPYGERLGDVAEARAVYKTLGQRVMNAHLGAYVISPDEQFEKFFDRRADKKRKLYNGMLKCNVYMYR